MESAGVWMLASHFAERVMQRGWVEEASLVQLVLTVLVLTKGSDA